MRQRFSAKHVLCGARTSKLLLSQISAKCSPETGRRLIVLLRLHCGTPSFLSAISSEKLAAR